MTPTHFTLTLTGDAVRLNASWEELLDTDPKIRDRLWAAAAALLGTTAPDLAPYTRGDRLEWRKER